MWLQNLSGWERCSVKNLIVMCVLSHSISEAKSKEEENMSVGYRVGDLFSCCNSHINLCQMITAPCMEICEYDKSVLEAQYY